MRTAEFDIVVYGATGFTGRLVAEHFVERYSGGDLRWAMAGRNPEKLAAVRAEIGAPADTPLIVADPAVSGSLEALAARTRAVVTTVGPYQRYGSELVAACANAGTDYLDLCGEPAWMRHMIDTHEARARVTGARLLFSCGFDSIPFELGTFFLQQQASAQFGGPVPRVKARVRKLDGKLSGGTIASLTDNITSAAHSEAEAALIRNTFALTPGFTGPEQPAGTGANLDPDLGAWVAPFVMAPINTRNLHRSNFLQGHRYGADFVYDEMTVAGSEASARAMAEAFAAGPGGHDAPKPGTGPSKEERERGSFDVLLIGIARDGRQLRAAVTGNKDPGYGCTSMMIGETAVCLVREAPEVPGGFWTPAAALGDRLLTHLTAHAGMTFAVES